MTLANGVLVDALACTLSTLPEQETLVYDVAHGRTVLIELANNVIETFGVDSLSLYVNASKTLTAS